MKLMNKRGLVAVSAVAAASLLTVGVSPVSAAPSTTVTIWMDQGSKDAVGAALTAFDKADKTLTINMVVKDFGTLRSSAITAITKGTGPDILAGAHDWTGKLLGAGVISPVSLGANASKFSAAAKSGFTINGKLYGVPGWTENIALVYNKKKVSSPVKTTAAFQAAIAAGKVGVSTDLTGQGDPYHMSAFATSFGIDQYKRAGGTWTSTAGYVGTAANNYANWLAGDGKKLVFGGWDATAGAFQDPASDVAYWVTGPWGSGTVVNDSHPYGTPKVTPAKLTAKDIGVVAIPSVGGKPVHQFAGVRGYWQSVKVPGSSKARSVGKVLSALAGKTIQLASFTKKGNTPANADALKLVNDPLVKGFGIAGKGAYPMPSFVFQDTTWKKIGESEVAILKGNIGDKTPAAYLSDAMKSLQETIDGN